MEIELNGEPKTVADGSSLADLVVELGLDGRRLAVEHNGEIVPRTDRDQRRLAAGDHVEIVHAIGGGAC